jgi:hypothetical protein
MRPTLQFRDVLASSLLLAALACSGSESAPTEVKPQFAVSCSPARPTITTTSPVTRTPNSGPYTAKFTVKNNCTVTLSGWVLTTSRTGSVTTVSAPSPQTFTGLAPGQSISVSATYSVGAAGTGTVVLTATSDVGTTSSGVLNVTVTASAIGIPYGLSGLTFNPLTPGAQWTGGSRTIKNLNNVLNLLQSAYNQSPRVGMWINLVGENDQFKNPDSSFNLNRWKDTLDKYADTLPNGISSFNDTLGDHVLAKTLQGSQLLDDLASFHPNVSFADIEAMAAYSKKRYPAVPTSVRQAATDLQAKAPLCGSCPGGHSPYTKLDAGWAQYKLSLGDATAYRNNNITAAKNEKLGLVIGINIKDGSLTQDTLTIAQIRNVGNIFLAPGASASDYVCGFIMYNVAYPNLTDPVFDDLAALASGHVASSCKQRP